MRSAYPFGKFLLDCRKKKRSIENICTQTTKKHWIDDVSESKKKCFPSRLPIANAQQQQINKWKITTDRCFWWVFFLWNIFIWLLLIIVLLCVFDLIEKSKHERWNGWTKCNINNQPKILRGMTNAFFFTDHYLHQYNFAHTTHTHQAHICSYKTIKWNFNHLSNFVCCCGYCSCCQYGCGVFAQSPRHCRSLSTRYSRKKPPAKLLRFKLLLRPSIARLQDNNAGFGQDERDYHAQNHHLHKEIKNKKTVELKWRVFNLVAREFYAVFFFFAKIQGVFRSKYCEE